MRALTDRDRDARIQAIPFQEPGVLRTFGLTVDACERASWAITPHQERHRGAAAMLLALSVAIGNPWPFRLYRVPVLRQLVNGAYLIVTRVRHRLPGDQPHCSQHPEVCS